MNLVDLLSEQVDLRRGTNGSDHQIMRLYWLRATENRGYIGI